MSVLAYPQPDLERTAKVSEAGNRPPALRVSGIDFSYGQLQVLFEVSLEVGQGETLALLGTNGAGKSTLLRAIAGLEKPSAGTVSYFGDDITGIPAERLAIRGLLVVVGGRGVFADMTVDENLEMQALTSRLDRSRQHERRELVYDTFPALAARRRQKAGNLSGGEQQQVAVAKALLLDPKVLCIDELSLGLAPVVVGELLEVVRRVRATGVTMIVVEQSLNIAAEICERAVFLEKGQVRFEGLTRDLIERDDIARAVFLGSGPSAETHTATSDVTANSAAQIPRMGQ
jgi:ABC-type branched-subunit amino acid transport system ATPase component